MALSSLLSISYPFSQCPFVELSKQMLVKREKNDAIQLLQTMDETSPTAALSFTPTLLGHLHLQAAHSVAFLGGNLYT
jgi:hypothetical protein